MKTSHFAIVRKSILISKRCTPKYVYEVDQELGDGQLSLFACPGLENRPPRKSKFVNPCRYARGVGGGVVMVRGQIEPSITSEGDSLIWTIRV